MEVATDPDAKPDGREHFIPARKIDLIDALLAEGVVVGEVEKDKFRKLCRLLGAIFHHEYFDQLERLRNDYFHFDPERAAPPPTDAATRERVYRDLVDALKLVVHGANFIEVGHDEIERAHREHAIIRVNVKVPLDAYREVRFFRRGHHQETIELTSWFGLRKRQARFWVYDDVILMVTMKDAPATAASKQWRHKPRVRPGAMLLKCFRDIASADLNALFPDVRVVMGRFDQIMIGVPALIGVVPIVLKLASTVTVLFVVAAFYLGLSQELGEADTAGALAALGGIVALGGLVFRQWVKFQRQSLLYHKVLADNVYYRNVNNNGGLFDYLIGEAEEQECKEAMLAYHFLLGAGAEGLTSDVLDQRIESWLRGNFKDDIDFECDDALTKLDRLRLLVRNGDTLAVVPLDEALRCLDRVWDDFFPPDTQQAAARA